MRTSDSLGHTVRTGPRGGERGTGAKEDGDLGGRGLDPAASGERAPGRGDIDTTSLGAAGGPSPARGKARRENPEGRETERRGETQR